VKHLQLPPNNALFKAGWQEQQQQQQDDLPRALAKLVLRLVATRAVARARESRYHPRVGERRAKEGRWPTASGGGIASLSPALERPPGRKADEREARNWRGESAGESDVARSDWSTCRDLIGPRVLAVATSRF
jgi:hypothetical protein